MIEVEKGKTPVKGKWEIPAIIALMPILGINNPIPILHMSKRTVNIYTTGKTINQFTIGYMIKTSLKFNNAFRKNLKNAWVFLFLLGKREILKIV